MYFHEFAQKIGNVLLGSNNTATFVRSLLESIIPEDQYDLLDEIRPCTFKAYYNGNAKITSLARKINVVVDVSLFEESIKDLGDVTIQKLSREFSDIFPKINPKNTAKKLAELFDKIITEAAAVPKRQNQKELTEKQSCDAHDEKDDGGLNQHKVLETEIGQDFSERIRVKVADKLAKVTEKLEKLKRKQNCQACTGIQRVQESVEGEVVSTNGKNLVAFSKNGAREEGDQNKNYEHCEPQLGDNKKANKQFLRMSDGFTNIEQTAEKITNNYGDILGDLTIHM